MSTEPFPLTQEQRDALTRQRRRNGTIRAAAQKDGPSHGARLARKLLRENASSVDSTVDVARKTLQRRGWVVYSATVVGGPRDMWICGHRTVTTDELLEMAAG